MADRNIENLTEPLYIGSGSNRTKFDTDGSLTLEGNATVWEDVTFPLVARRLDSTVGSLNYNYDNGTITMQGGGDLTDTRDSLMFTCQVPHGVKVGGSAKLHIHWEQAADEAYTFDVSYRVQNNGDAKTVAWSAPVTVTMANNAFAYSSGTLNQITSLLNIDLANAGLSALIQFKLTRSDNVAGDIEAMAVDVHFEKDALGSKSEFSKE